MDITTQEILKVAALALGGSWLIQISPIKINPWTWMARSIGRAINGELIEKVDNLEKQFKQMQEDDAEREAKSARIRILRFGDECQQQHDCLIPETKKHSKTCTHSVLGLLPISLAEAVYLLK